LPAEEISALLNFCLQIYFPACGVDFYFHLLFGSADVFVKKSCVCGD
jgi:hypothetical protein